LVWSIWSSLCTLDINPLSINSWQRFSPRP
jgi:hypothetical protein